MVGGLALCVIASIDYVYTHRTEETQMEAITARSLELFLAYAKDAANWSGTPLVGGNVGGSQEDRGNLTQLKQAGLIDTFRYDGDTWIEFTTRGQALALEHDIFVYRTTNAEKLPVPRGVSGQRRTDFLSLTDDQKRVYLYQYNVCGRLAAHAFEIARRS